MKNILIVDDNHRNREFISTLCSDYAEDNDLDLKLYEASDGIEALQVCETNPIDLVFMDIMMPRMDGIEATKAIRKKNKQIMIIAISAAADEERKSHILQEGAEDYVSKPVISSVFLKRLDNYLRIHTIRTQAKEADIYHPSTYNLYCHTIYSFQLNFTIKTEDCLAVFWEQMLVLNILNNTNERLSELVRIIYTIGTVLTNKKFTFNIYIEEDDDYHYFTLNQVNLLNARSVLEKVTKNYPGGEFILKGSRISFRLPKVETPGCVSAYPDRPVRDTLAETPMQCENITGEVCAKEQPLRVYDFMEKDHLSELESMAKHLNTTMLYLRSSVIGEEEVMEIVDTLRSIGDILSIYSEVYTIGDSFESLSAAIETNLAAFRERSKEFSELFYAFTRDLDLWIDKLFFSGAPSLHFLDDSITSNALMIQSFLQPQGESGVELDDIFDF